MRIYQEFDFFSLRILFQLALGKNSDKLEISWTWLLELHISSKILHHNIAKSSARRQREAVKNAQVLEPDRLWLKTWLFNVKELDNCRQVSLLEPLEGETIISNIGTSKISKGPGTNHGKQQIMVLSRLLSS